VSSLACEHFRFQELSLHEKEEATAQPNGRALIAPATAASGFWGKWDTPVMFPGFHLYGYDNSCTAQCHLKGYGENFAIVSGTGIQCLGRMGHPAGPPWPLCSWRQHCSSRAISGAASDSAAGAPLLHYHNQHPPYPYAATIQSGALSACHDVTDSQHFMSEQESCQ